MDSDSLSNPSNLEWNESKLDKLSSAPLLLPFVGSVDQGPSVKLYVDLEWNLESGGKPQVDEHADCCSHCVVFRQTKIVEVVFVEMQFLTTWERRVLSRQVEEKDQCLI